MSELTEREKAALYYHVFAGVDDWKVLHGIATNKATKELEQIKFYDTIVSKWKRSDKVQKYLKELQDQKTLKEWQRKKEILEEYERGREGESKEHTQSGTKSKKAEQIDYTRPENQRTLLNDLINTAGDQKDKLDALKTIIQAQKDDRQAAKDNQIQRFYSPLRCSSCPLYQKANKNLTI